MENNNNKKKEIRKTNQEERQFRKKEDVDKRQLRSRSRSKSRQGDENNYHNPQSYSSEEEKLPSDMVVKGRGFKQRKIIRSSLRGWEEEDESFHEANSKLKEYFN